MGADEGRAFAWVGRLRNQDVHSNGMVANLLVCGLNDIKAFEFRVRRDRHYCWVGRMLFCGIWVCFWGYLQTSDWCSAGYMWRSSTVFILRVFHFDDDAFIIVWRESVRRRLNLGPSSSVRKVPERPSDGLSNNWFRTHGQDYEKSEGFHLYALRGHAKSEILSLLVNLAIIWG